MDTHSQDTSIRFNVFMVGSTRNVTVVKTRPDGGQLRIHFGAQFPAVVEVPRFMRSRTQKLED